MIASSRRWFRRNRTNFAIGAGVLGAGYLAGQFVLGKVSEARQRMSEERIAKEKYVPAVLYYRLMFYLC
jgi:peroxin-3